MNHWLIYVFLLLAIPIAGWVDEKDNGNNSVNESENLRPAPLIPLEPEYALDLSHLNRINLLENPKRLEEVKDQIQRYLDAHTFPWLSLLILVSSTGIGWIVYQTKDFWYKPVVKEEVRISTKEMVERMIEELKKKQGGNGSEKEYYTKLGIVLQSSVEDVCGWKKRERTASEVLNGIQNVKRMSSDEKSVIRELFEEIDRVKFGKAKRSAKESEADLERLQEVVSSLYNS